VEDMSMIEHRFSNPNIRLLNIFLAVVLIDSLVWVSTLAFPTSAQACSDESWIRPETISSGLAPACGIRGDGTLVCLGRNDDGHPTLPGSIFRQVSAGRFHTCDIRNGGTLTCWGEDLHDKLSPQFSLYNQLSAGDQHTCAERSDGVLFRWGLDDV
jgi:alpha-tubulin suppressor-like RCC1 family protein